MKKVNIFLSLMLAVVMMITVNINSYAFDFSEFLGLLNEYEEEEQRRIDEIVNSSNSQEWLDVVVENVPLNNSISTYSHCLECYTIANTVCLMDATLYDEGYHSGIFGIGTTDCYAYYFCSRGVEMCMSCGNVVSELGVHDCWEIHKSCNKGEYDVCPMEYSSGY